MTERELQKVTFRALDRLMEDPEVTGHELDREALKVIGNYYVLKELFRDETS